MDKTMMITIGAAALATFAATAQDLPAPVTLPAIASQPIAEVVDLEPGAECKVYLVGGIESSMDGGRYSWDANLKIVKEILRNNPTGTACKFDDSEEFDGKKVGAGVDWNVVTWKGFLTYSKDATVTFLTNSRGPYTITINETTWGGHGQKTVSVPLKNGRNKVVIGKIIPGRAENTPLTIQYRTTEFGKYKKFSPRNLFHEPQEDDGGEFGSF